MTSDWLSRALEESRARGFLGPGPLEAQIRHARAFALIWESHNSAPPLRFLDLGSGGGLPGLVLLERWGTPGVLLDSMERRTDFLQETLGLAGAPGGALVWRGRAEVVSREERADHIFDLITSRSFGPPAVTAECAVRFAAVGGLIIVSEPPERGERWPAEGLRKLNLVSMGIEVADGFGFRVLRKVDATPETFPRPVGRPAKSPLF